MLIMAGIFGRLIRPPEKMVLDPKVLELQTAKEILAEVFGIKLSEVDEMIQNRFEVAGSEKIGSKENGLWPQEFQLEG